MDIRIFNYIEAGLWFAISAAIFIVSSLRSMSTKKKSNATLAAGAFLAFGVSDLIEARTGSWWNPPALLALNIACVVVLTICLIRHRGLS